jgi:hypothetical protein
LTALEKSIDGVLSCLAGVQRDDTGYGWATGDMISNSTGLSSDDINDAVTLLVQSGHARWLAGIGSHPWRFVLVAMTPQGRAMYEKAKSGSAITKNQGSVTVNINAENFSGIAAGSVSGQTSIVSHQNKIAFDPNVVRHAIEEVKKYKVDLGLTSQDSEALDREIEAVDAELLAETPNQSKVRKAIASMRGIIEGGVQDGIKTVIATGVIHLLAGLM